MECLHCGQDMTPSEDVWVCAHGIFAPAEALEGRFRPTRRLLDKARPTAPGRCCPGCSGTLWVHDSVSMEVDICPDCGGLWLDWDESAYLEAATSPAEGAWAFISTVQWVLRRIR